MRHLKLLCSFLLVSFLILGCDNDTIQPSQKKMPIVGELPVYYEVLSDSSLITKADMEYQFVGCTINSSEELELQLGKKFLTAYPAYSTVNFDDYTLLVRTAIVFNNIVGRHPSFYQELSTGHFVYNINYLYVCGDIVPHVERTGIVVHKLDEHSIIDYTQSVMEM